MELQIIGITDREYTSGGATKRYLKVHALVELDAKEGKGQKGSDFDILPDAVKQFSKPGKYEVGIKLVQFGKNQAVELTSLRLLS